jgi:methylated-DNA-[protein]-cysteine S-methyltransferase
MARRAPDDDAVIRAPFGRVRLRLRAGVIDDVDFLSGAGALSAPSTAAGRRACALLARYFADSRTRLDAALMLDGTAFQRRVWRALRRIPSGRVMTYGELARKLKTSARAVGNACRANPVPLFVPCHRVVAADGQGGFMGRRGGAAVALKTWLLAHERARR